VKPASYFINQTIEYLFIM